MLPLPFYLTCVLDLTDDVAGAAASRALGDFGAEVIWLEATARHSHLRSLPEFPDLARNKLSCAINAGDGEGMALLLGLAGTANVVIAEAGVWPELDFAALTRLQSDIIVVEIPAGAHASLGIATAAAVTAALFQRRYSGATQRVVVDTQRLVNSMAAPLLVAGARGLAIGSPQGGATTLNGTSIREQLDALGYYETVAAPSGISRRQGIPYQFSLTPAHVRLPEPEAGEHTSHVLKSRLGLSQEELTALAARGVVGL